MPAKWRWSTNSNAALFVRASSDVLDVMELFDETIGRVPLDAEENEALSGNAAIETAINQLYEQEGYSLINREDISFRCISHKMDLRQQSGSCVQ